MADREIAELIEDFLEEFKTTHLHGAELRISSGEVRQFLKENNIAMSFREFNEILGYKRRTTGNKRRTTGNKYVYNIGVLLAEPAKEKEVYFSPDFREGEFLLDYTIRIAPLSEAWSDRFERSINRWITTLNWYGSKRSWAREFTFFYEMAAQLGCTKMVDCFAGSGFLGLLAAKSGYFEGVVLNEASCLVYNYHMVMKDIYAFNTFCENLKEMGNVSKETYDTFNSDLYKTGDSKAGREKRKQWKTSNVKQAMEFYVVKHYSFQGQGSYTSKREAPSFYIENLWRTHQLYSKIELKNLHYLKVLKNSLDDEKSLIVLDPPYLQETRVQKKSYGLEFTERQHRTMLQTLTQAPVAAKVLVCGYDSKLYQRYFKRAGWHCVRLKKAGKKSVGEEGKELLWFNFGSTENLVEYGEMFDLLY